MLSRVLLKVRKLSPLVIDYLELLFLDFSIFTSDADLKGVALECAVIFAVHVERAAAGDAQLSVISGGNFGVIAGYYDIQIKNRVVSDVGDIGSAALCKRIGGLIPPYSFMHFNVHTDLGLGTDRQGRHQGQQGPCKHFHLASSSLANEIACRWLLDRL